MKGLTSELYSELYSRSLLKYPNLLWISYFTSELYITRRALAKAIMYHRKMAKGIILDIGCGSKPYENFFIPLMQEYYGLDLPPDRSSRTRPSDADVYGNAMNLPFKAGSVDTILCTQVLEHIPDPSVALIEMNRCLKSRGVLILTVPLTEGLHEEPNDFFRYTKYGLKYLAEKSGFKIIKITPTTGLWGVLGQKINTLIFRLGGVACLPVLWVTQWFFIGMDALLKQAGDTIDYIMICRK